MNVFTEVYQKTVDLLKTNPLDASWGVIETKLKILLCDDGPDATQGAALDDLRSHINNVSKSGMPSGRAEAILAASKPDSPGFQERAALIKTMQHCYLIAKKGNQSLWVIDSPKAYGAWAYDQFDGKEPDGVKTELEKEEEVYGLSNRRMMSDALQLARKWSLDAQIRLANADADLLKKVRCWFHGDLATDLKIAASRAILQDGFKRIAASCNSTQVIFSDRPHLRSRPDYADVHASVNARDNMPIIYIYEAFLRSGKRNVFGQRPELWNCAITIIHELSHKLVNTVDVKYAFEGLRPGRDLTEEEALKNAETWAFFAADIVGALGGDSVRQALE
jgi:hypothetical protein